MKDMQESSNNKGNIYNQLKLSLLKIICNNNY